jgi:hypothetical protein
LLTILKHITFAAVSGKRYRQAQEKQPQELDPNAS